VAGLVHRPPPEASASQGAVPDLLAETIRVDASSAWWHREDVVAPGVGHALPCGKPSRCLRDTVRDEGIDHWRQEVDIAHAALGLRDVTSRAAIDRRSTRSAASHAVTRQPVALAVQSNPAIRSRFGALRFGNANGEDVHVLPAIVLIGHPEKGMAVLDIRDPSIWFRQVTCIEDGEVPSDALVVGKTWDKVNKDGTPDGRFRDNRERAPGGIRRIDVYESARAS